MRGRTEYLTGRYSECNEQAQKAVGRADQQIVIGRGMSALAWCAFRRLTLPAFQAGQDHASTLRHIKEQQLRSQSSLA